MPYVFEDIDLEERPFSQRDVLAITGLTAKTLQNWNDRGIRPGPKQSPGKAGKRRYSGFEVIALGLMKEITELTRLPPSEALRIATEGIAMIKLGLDGEWMERPGPVVTSRDGVPARHTLLVYFHDGKWIARDSFFMPDMFAMLRETTTHLSIPVERIFNKIVQPMATRVYGESYWRDRLLEAPARKLRKLDDDLLEDYGLTRADIEKHIQERRGKRRKKDA